MGGWTVRRILPTRTKRESKQQRPAWTYIGGFLIFAWLTFMAAYAVMPFLWIFATSLRTADTAFNLPPAFFPQTWEWENWYNVLTSTRVNFPRFFINSLKIALSVTTFQLLTCSLAAFAFARLRFRGKSLLFAAFLATMMVPAQVTLVPRFIIVKSLGLIDTHWALILPAASGAYGVFLLRQFFMTLPGELIEAARLDGASFFRIYRDVMFPLIGPGLSALGIFTFLHAWNDFFGPLIYLRSWDNYTLPIAIVLLQGYFGDGSRAQVLAAICISVLPVLLVFLVAQRHVVRGIALTGIKV
jgi:multiple sugar transport system permease protein